MCGVQGQGSDVAISCARKPERRRQWLSMSYFPLSRNVLLSRNILIRPSSTTITIIYHICELDICRAIAPLRGQIEVGLAVCMKTCAAGWGLWMFCSGRGREERGQAEAGRR